MQCELARVARHDPRRHDLRARERDLLHDHLGAWLQGLPPLARYGLRRGFVETANVARPAPFLDAFDEIAAVAPLLSDLTLRRFAGVYQLAALAPERRVAALRLVNPTAAAMSALGEVELPALRELEVRTVFEDDEPPLINAKYLAKTLAALGGDRLRGLTLGGGAFEDPGLRLVAGAELTGLSSLSLSDADLAPGDLAALASAPAFARLRELELTRCRLGDDGAELLARAAPAGLTRLVVEGNGIGPRGAAALAGLSSLAELRLSGNPLGDAGAAALAGGLAGLRVLGLAEAQLGAAGIAALAAAPFLPGLAELDLGDNPLGERGGRALLGAPLHGLAALRLHGTLVGDAFVPLLTGGLPALRVLDVTSCGLDAPALAALRGKRLLELRAGRNDLGDDGVAALAGLGLQVLDLSNTGLGEAGVRRLCDDPGFARLRELDVHHNRLSSGQLVRLAERF